MAKPIVTAERVRELLSYDPHTGLFCWKVTRKGPVFAGHPAGFTDREGYRKIGLEYNVIQSHRLAWAYVYGEWPKGSIDHINGDRADNRIDNLRIATVRENGQNIKKATAQSSHGWLGATYDKRKRRWRARIRVEGRKLSLGMYSTAEEAHHAYIAAKRRLHPFSTL